MRMTFSGARAATRDDDTWISGRSGPVPPSAPGRRGRPGRGSAFPALACAALALLALLARPLLAEGPGDGDAAGDQTIDAVRVDQAPTIDGVLDEAIWQQASVITDFVQQEPQEGAPATEKTEVRLLYDGKSLFLGVHAYDRDPGGIVATEMRRDGNRIMDEDNFEVILDTFGDRRNGYMFVTTPLGAKLDQQVSDDGGIQRRGTGNSVNKDWDGVWYVRSRETSDGWVAEIAIPMVTLRFPDSEPQTWGINFMRNIRRKNEQVYWSPIPKGYTLTKVSLAGSLNDLESLNQGMDLRVKPYVTGGGHQVVEQNVTDNSGQSDFGVDVKYGVTASLNLDLTYNTDFAQAEVDDQRVNLTRFALYYPEKRDFFLENYGQFLVGTTSSIRPIADLFFSRSIGLANGQPVPIIGGARLTGKVGRSNIAVMDLETDRAFGNPGDNFLVARYSRDVFSRSRIGALVINKEGVGEDPTAGQDFNRTFAVDMSLAPLAALTIDGFLAATRSPGVDSGQNGGHLRAAWLDRSWNVYGEYTDLGDNFNDEVGYVPRVGIVRRKFHVEYNPRPEKWGIRDLEPMWNVTEYRSHDGVLESLQYHNMLGIRMEDGGYFNVWYNAKYELLDRPFRVHENVEIPAGRYWFGDWRFSYDSNPSRRVYYGVSYGPQTFWDGTRRDIGLKTGVRVTDQVAFEGNYSQNKVNLPEGDFTVNLVSLQADLALSPRMSLRTRTQYESDTDQWVTSARFRYIYKPGSDLYIVYDEVRRDPTGLPIYRDRQLLVKMTYLMSF